MNFDGWVLVDVGIACFTWSRMLLATFDVLMRSLQVHSIFLPHLPSNCSRFYHIITIVPPLCAFSAINEFYPIPSAAPLFSHCLSDEKMSKSHQKALHMGHNLPYSCQSTTYT